MTNALASQEFTPDFLQEFLGESGAAVREASHDEASSHDNTPSGSQGVTRPEEETGGAFAGESLPGESLPGGTSRKRSSRRSFLHDEPTLMEMFTRLNGPADAVRSGDRQSLRDRLVLAHAPLVEHCARGFSATGEPVEDLLQEGYIGLIKAVDRFDPAKGVRFSTYACHLIAGEMRHYLRDLGRLIHEPGWHSQLRTRVVREAESLTQKLGRTPQAEEIASALNIQPQLVRSVLDTQNILTVESLDSGEDSEGNSRPSSEERAASSPFVVSSHVENSMLLDTALPKLRDLEQRAIRLFFYKEYSKTEIARELGISVNYASYLVKRGIEHLRHILEENETAREVAVTPEAKVEAPLTLETLAGWLDQKAIGRGQPFAVVIFRILNWQSAAARLKPEAREAAHARVEVLARGCCRLTDTVLPISVNYEDSAGDAASELAGGLHFVALLNNTDRRGQRVGERWATRCTSAAVSPQNPAAVDALLADYAFAANPADGATAAAIVRTLSTQL